MKHMVSSFTNIFCTPKAIVQMLLPMVAHFNYHNFAIELAQKNWPPLKCWIFLGAPCIYKLNRKTGWGYYSYMTMFLWLSAIRPCLKQHMVASGKINLAIPMSIIGKLPRTLARLNCNNSWIWTCTKKQTTPRLQLLLKVCLYLQTTHDVGYIYYNCLASFAWFSALRASRSWHVWTSWNVNFKIPNSFTQKRLSKANSLQASRVTQSPSIKNQTGLIQLVILKCCFHPQCEHHGWYNNYNYKCGYVWLCARTLWDNKFSRKLSNYVLDLCLIILY